MIDESIWQIAEIPGADWRRVLRLAKSRETRPTSGFRATAWHLSDTEKEGDVPAGGFQERGELAEALYKYLKHCPVLECSRFKSDRCHDSCHGPRGAWGSMAQSLGRLVVVGHSRVSKVAAQKGVPECASATRAVPSKEGASGGRAAVNGLVLAVPLGYLPLTMSFWNTTRSGTQVVAKGRGGRWRDVTIL